VTDKGKVVSEDTGVLTEEEKSGLLNLARKSLQYYLQHGEEGEPADLGVSITVGMEQIMGAFVTINKFGNLRGCIGEITPRRELYKAVKAHAVNAGVRDYRFSPVKSNELKDLRFEISALTPPIPVPSSDDIIIGTHGIVLSSGLASAVFLPQVAPEQGWTLEETLEHLSMKAGLNRHGWKDAEFMVFEAVVFSE
jgi:AmmeMemoRadiSam system protein A